MKHKKRLDIFIYENGLADSRQLAQNYIIQGRVKVNDKIITKPGTNILPEDSVKIDKPEKVFSSRGGIKLEHALKEFEITPENMTVLDAGASNGGFTDCLLQKKAKKIYAADVGKGQLDYKLQINPVVVVMDECNVRYLKRDDFEDNIDFITADLSFISLEKVLKTFANLLSEKGQIVALVKPQFEAGKGRTEKGVVKKINIHIEVLEKAIQDGINAGLYPHKMTWSPIKGPSGNIEFFILYTKNNSENLCVAKETAEKAWNILNKES